MTSTAPIPPHNVSVVIPVYNERENVGLLCEELSEVFAAIPGDHEFLFVDDGSVDGTHRVLMELRKTYPLVRIIRFRRNFGQTAAMQAGFERARGDVIVTLDGDRQNDPHDIPMMLEKLSEGYDLVHGWRQQRQDSWLTRKLPSKIANWLIARSTSFPVHDLGCTLKVMRTRVARELKLYGEMHRFIPILAAQRGARCTEVVTHHRPRIFGQSKYGLSRTVRVMLDLLTVKYLQSYFASPMRLFGVLALLSCACGLAAGLTTISMKFFFRVDMTGNPLLLLSVFCLLAGIQLFGLGLLGEVLSRIYFEGSTTDPYAIEFDTTDWNRLACDDQHETEDRQAA